MTLGLVICVICQVLVLKHLTGSFVISSDSAVYSSQSVEAPQKLASNSSPKGSHS